jgi:hypothetical protein
MLEVYDRMSALVHYLVRCVKLPTNEVSLVLDLAEVIVRDLQLPILI